MFANIIVVIVLFHEIKYVHYSGKPGNRCWSYWGVSRPTRCRYDFGILEVILLYIFIDISDFVQIMFFMTLVFWRSCHITFIFLIVSHLYNIGLSVLVNIQ